MTNFQFPQHIRLEPRTPFKGGRITDTDILTLTEAARFASVHAGADITPADFLRAAGRGEITLRAIVRQGAKLHRIGGGVYCNSGQPTENTVPSGSILDLPLSACKQLAATGRSSWRTFDGFERIEGILMRYTVAELVPAAPDFETTPDDCRVTGDAVNALADAYIDEPAPATDTATPAPVVAVELTSDARPDPERRLELLRSLGGTAKYIRCEWKFTGINALVESEKASGRKRSTEKTIRADLKEAAQNERDASRAGFGDGLGQR